MSQYELIVTPRRGLWYFAHPYTVLDVLSRPNDAAMEANWRLCCLRAARLVEAGWLIYAPVCHTHPIKAAWPQFMAEHTEDRWYEFDHRFVQEVMFAGIILPPGWQDSGGCGQGLPQSLLAGQILLLQAIGAAGQTQGQDDQ